VRTVNYLMDCFCSYLLFCNLFYKNANVMLIVNIMKM
jgi:hypothetical protein